jgi:RNA ligase
MSNFPVINTIDDVLPHIEGNDNFSVNRKDDYIVIDYILNTPDTFHNAYERECRGIIFHADGPIMSRPYHKFFNMDERPETMIQNVDFSKPHVRLEKLDGSMIRPIFVNGKLTWGSKAGETFLTPQIEHFVEDNPQYRSFALNCILFYTPIFEWCSRQNRVVIDHPVDRLVLTAIRDNITGEYVSHSQLKNWALTAGLDYVKAYEGNSENIDAFVEEVKLLQGAEGFVIRFDDGLMLKLKANEYIRFHRAKDNINLEKNVVNILVNDQADDFRTLLMASDRDRFEKFELYFWWEMKTNAARIWNEIYHLQWESVTKKQFALEYQQEYPVMFRPIFFSHLEGKEVSSGEILEDLKKLVKKNCHSQSAIDKVRSLWNDLSWYDVK